MPWLLIQELDSVIVCLFVLKEKSQQNKTRTHNVYVQQKKEEGKKRTADHETQQEEKRTRQREMSSISSSSRLGKDEPKEEDTEEEEDEEEEAEAEAEDEDDEATELPPSSPEVLNKYRVCGDIVNAGIHHIMNLCVPGASILQICDAGDAFLNKRLAEVFTKPQGVGKKRHTVEKGICFPTCLSSNHIVGHFSPAVEEKAVLAAADIVKMYVCVWRCCL